MSDISDRTRAEAQRDIAVAALKKLDSLVLHRFKDANDAADIIAEALARIAEIEATKPSEAP